MAHPNTEAAPQDGVNTDLTVPHVTKALTVEEAAAELSNYFDDNPADQHARNEENAEQAEIRDGLKNITLDENGEAVQGHSPLDFTDDDPQTVDPLAFTQDDPEDQEQDYEGGEETDQVSAIPAPISWSKEDSEVFSSLPPDAQSIIVERERERDKGLQSKTTEIADQRRNLQMLEQQTIAERQMYAEGLYDKVEANMVAPDEGMIDPASPRYNPAQFYADKKQFDHDVAQQQYLQQSLSGYQTLAAQNDEMMTMDEMRDNEDRLNDALHGWRDPEHRHQVLEYGSGFGFSPTEIKTASPAEVILLEKAMRYDQMMAQKPDLKSQLKRAPKVQKPGAKSNSASKRSGLLAAQKKLKQTGTVEDAAAVLSLMMKD